MTVFLPAVAGRAGDYHDLSRTPRHGYIAFYLWLRQQGLAALVHIGAHGTLEWLNACAWPAASPPRCSR